MVWLIDENGERREFSSIRSELFHGLRMSQDECLEYAIKNLGFAALRRRKSGFELAWRPAIVTDITLSGIFYEVSDLSGHALAMRWFEEGHWRFRVLPADWTARIEAIGAAVNDERQKGRDRVIFRAMNQGDLEVHEVFGALVRRWRKASDRCSATLTAEVRENVSTISQGKYCFLRIRRGGNELEPVLLLDEVGQGFPKPVVEFLSPVLGQPINQHKDERYGHYVLQTYIKVASSRSPAAHDVDALIETEGYGKMRRRYKRLILPFQDARGDALMASISVPDDTLDLRV